MDILLKHIWSKLGGKPRIDAVKIEIDRTQKTNSEQINQIAAYLQVAMDEDPEFAYSIRLMAKEINAGKLVDQSNMTQNISDQARGWQTKVEGGTAYIGEIHIQGKPE